MFGLMRGAPRLPYCGTCKTMGALYGQRTRMLLNHDAVFLAELLMVQSGEPKWSDAYRSFNCAAVPKMDRPVALEFAATVAVILAHFKIADHRQDSGKRRWTLAARFFSPGYRRAAARLTAWNFPLDELIAILASQKKREARAESIADVAEPTAFATALVFEHGALIAGQPDLSLKMHRIGRLFGFIIYLLDAHEDRARDARTGEFNALAAFPALDGKAEILRLTAELEPLLPADLATRLRVNVEERLGLRPRVLQHRCRQTVSPRWREAVSFAQRMKEKEHAGILKGSAVFVTAAIAMFLVPNQARSAESWRHCLGLGMNLMALGGVVAMASVPPPVHEHARKAAEAAGGGLCGGCGDWCGDGCCDGCDCGDCCSGCDC